MKIEDLDEMLLDEIFSYVPLKDHFTTIRYISHKFKDASEYYNNPMEICTADFKFLNVSQLCKLIKQCTMLKKFHFLYGTVYAKVLKHLCLYSNSLRSLKFSFCNFEYVPGYRSMKYLIGCGRELEELVLISVNVEKLGYSLNAGCLIPTLPSMKKLAITLTYLSTDVLKNLIKACPNLTDISLHVIPEKVVPIFIEKFGRRLKELNYILSENDTLMKQLGKFTQLATLGITDNDYISSDIEIPYLPNAVKFVMGFNMKEVGISPSQISKSLPNLKEITYHATVPLDSITISFITSYPYLRKISIISLCTKNNLLLIFKQCKHIKFAKFSDECLIDLSEEEAKEHLSGLYFIQIYDTLYFDESIARRVASWLSPTKIFVGRYSLVREVLRKIWPEVTISQKNEKRITHK